MSHEIFRSVTELTIDEGSAGQRIDNFLAKSLKGVPKSRLYRILRKGEVRVNKGRIKPDYRLQMGDVVRIPPIRVASPSSPPPMGSRLLGLLDQSIIHEDSRLLVLNKPSGVAVHGGSGVNYGVIEGLRALRPKAPYLELGHRLDRDTSGVLVIAKRRSALRAFHEQLRGGTAQKHYITLVEGQWRGGRRGVDAPLRKNTLSSGERMVRVDKEGKAALTIFEPVTIYPSASLLAVQLKTGRTHQIRVHARHVGHPIAGDGKYGSNEFNSMMAGVGLKRLFLHAARLLLPAVDGVAAQEFEAPLGQELERVVERCADLGQ